MALRVDREARRTGLAQYPHGVRRSHTPLCRPRHRRVRLRGDQRGSRCACRWRVLDPDLDPDVDRLRRRVQIGNGPMLGALVLFFVYDVVCEGLFGRMLGKRILGLRVVGEDGSPIFLGAAFLRSCCIVDGLFSISSPPSPSGRPRPGSGSATAQRIPTSCWTTVQPICNECPRAPNCDRHRHTVGTPRSTPRTISGRISRAQNSSRADRPTERASTRHGAERPAPARHRIREAFRADHTPCRCAGVSPDHPRRSPRTVRSLGVRGCVRGRVRYLLGIVWIAR